MKLAGTAILACLLLPAGCKSEAELNAIIAKATALRTSPDYLIGEGDEITIQVLGTDTPLVVTQPVRPDGKVSFPGHGDVQVSGKTAAQLRSNLEAEFAKSTSLGLRNPRIHVSVNAFRSQQVTVLGEVARAGRFPYTGEMRVTDLLGMTGSLNDLTAAPNRVLLFREVEGKTKAYKVRMKDFTSKGDFTTNFYVRPGDILYVPRSGYAKFALWIERILLPVRAITNGIGIGNEATTILVPSSPGTY
jgi:polysaccharide export outer membrane protein